LRAPITASIVLFTLALVVPGADAATTLRVNPVRRVITMLQMMQKKVDEESVTERKLFDKYMCYCEESLQKLRAEIGSLKETIPQLEGSIKEGIAEKNGLQNDINDATAEVADARKTLEEATSIRNKEHKDFTEQSNQYKVDIGALQQAVAAMRKNGGFLQVDLSSSIRKLVATNVDISSSDREIVTNFLAEASNSDDQESESDPAEITGILDQMLENMIKEKSELITSEDAAVKSFESLKKAKDSQISTLQKDIETKTARMGKVSVQIVEDKQKLDEAEKALEDNTKMEANLSKQCKDRSDEFDAASTTRQQELDAIGDTMKLLNNDLAENLFKKSLPAGAAASFLQLEASPKQLKGEALKALESSLPADGRDARVNFVALALKSKKTSFSKVLEMVDGMVTLLNKEQQDDESKKSYCQDEIDKTDDEKKELENDISDLKKAVEDEQQKMKTVLADIKAKEESIVTLDEQVAEATKQRKEEHEDFVENLAANNAAKDILGVARTRLGKFYDAEEESLLQKKPLAKSAAKLGHTRSEGGHVAHIMSAKGKASLSMLFEKGTAPFFTQVDMETQTAEQTAAYHKKKEDGDKVISLINSLVADIAKEVQEMEKEEKDAQDAYEYALKESANKRAGDAKALSDLEGYKAESEAAIHQMTERQETKSKESIAKGAYLKDLHKQCDFILKYFKTRRDARTSEIDALQKAKAVLTGADNADASFLQVQTRHSTGRKSTWRGLRSSTR
jgi:chromosome segregation ATPase